MSKIAFTVSVPHEGPHIPQFSVSCNNATFLSFKGKDINNARWGNGNLVPKKGWKRLEFGVTGSSAATRFSVLLNTSVVLPPIAWSTPGPAPAASAARGASLPTKKDLKAGAKLLKETADGRQRLRIEGAHRDSDDRSHRRHRDDKEDSRTGRGERVRRSERRRHYEDEKRPVQAYEYSDDDDDSRSSGRTRHAEHKRDRGHRRDRKGRSEQTSEDEWEDQQRQERLPQRYEDDEDMRRINASSEAGRRRQRVTGKKINPKYHKSSRAGSTTGEDVEYIPERVYRREESPRPTRRHRRDRDLEPSHRRKGRRDSLRPVDYGYHPDTDNDYSAGFDGAVAD